MNVYLNDKIIDDQGNVKTITSGQDARLYYVDVNGERKKYLLDGEAAGGGEGGGASKSEPLFLYLVEKATSLEGPGANGVCIMEGEKFGTEPATTEQPHTEYYKSESIKTVYKNILWDITDDFVITPLDDLCFINGSSMSTTGVFNIKVELYIDDILVRHSDVIRASYYSSLELPILLTYVDYDKEITGKQLKVKVEYTYDNSQRYISIRSDVVQTRKYTDRTDNLTNSDRPITGLAKNIDAAAYFSDPRIQNELQSLNSRVSEKQEAPERYETSNGWEIQLADGYYYYMSNGNYISSLLINYIENNSMFRFNTDPNYDFSFDITVPDGWYINKPFDFKAGKSYIIATENNTIYWSEVQVK